MSKEINNYKSEFIEFLLGCGALRFGDFTTKSGRKSPYFINTGQFQDGDSLWNLSCYFARTLKSGSAKMPTNLFGPAYKGIPLVSGVSIACHQLFRTNITYTFNRKEAKDHGEQGFLVGNTYKSPESVYIVEDVITAGTSLKETLLLLEQYPNAKLEGIIVSIDRMEKMDSGLSALQEAQHEHGLNTLAIANIEDIIAFVSVPENRNRYGIGESLLERMHEYRAIYGATRVSN
jgi:orotate phosphoribosyltransferase